MIGHQKIRNPTYYQKKTELERQERRSNKKICNKKIDSLNPKLIVPDDYQQFWVHFEWFLALIHTFLSPNPSHAKNRIKMVPKQVFRRGGGALKALSPTRCQFQRLLRVGLNDMIDSPQNGLQNSMPIQIQCNLSENQNRVFFHNDFGCF